MLAPEIEIPSWTEQFVIDDAIIAHSFTISLSARPFIGKN